MVPRSFAAAVGVPLGLAMGWFRPLDAALTPLLEAVRFVAPIAWVPFAALWFGTGIGGPTLVIIHRRVSAGVDQRVSRRALCRSRA